MFLYSIYVVWLNTWVIPLGGSSLKLLQPIFTCYLAVSQGHSEKAQNEQVMMQLSEFYAANLDSA